MITKKSFDFLNIFLYCCKPQERFYTYVKNMFTSPK